MCQEPAQYASIPYVKSAHVMPALFMKQLGKSEGLICGHFLHGEERGNGGEGDGEGGEGGEGGGESGEGCEGGDDGEGGGSEGCGGGDGGGGGGKGGESCSAMPPSKQ